MCGCDCVLGCDVALEGARFCTCVHLRAPLCVTCAAWRLKVRVFARLCACECNTTLVDGHLRLWGALVRVLSCVYMFLSVRL